MGSPSAMDELLPFRQDGDNRGAPNVKRSCGSRPRKKTTRQRSLLEPKLVCDVRHFGERRGITSLAEPVLGALIGEIRLKLLL